MELSISDFLLTCPKHWRVANPRICIFEAGQIANSNYTCGTKELNSCNFPQEIWWQFPGNAGYNNTNQHLPKGAVWTLRYGVQCIGTLYHPFNNPWKIQEDVFNVVVFDNYRRHMCWNPWISEDWICPVSLNSMTLPACWVYTWLTSCRIFLKILNFDRPKFCQKMLKKPMVRRSFWDCFSEVEDFFGVDIIIFVLYMANLQWQFIQIYTKGGSLYQF